MSTSVLDRAKSLIPADDDHLLDTLIIAERGLPPERLLGRPHRGPRQEPPQHRGSASSVKKLSERPRRSRRRSDTDHRGPTRPSPCRACPSTTRRVRDSADVRHAPAGQALPDYGLLAPSSSGTFPHSFTFTHERDLGAGTWDASQ